MADATELFTRYQSRTKELDQIQRSNTDSITKLLAGNVIKPTDMLAIATEAMRPTSGYEMSRGRGVRPSVSEVLRASRASDLKYHMDTAGLINQGYDNAAHEMQLVINAVNAQTAQGNTQLRPIRSVMQSILPTLSPEEGVLFSRAYLGRIGQEEELTDQAAWSAAADVLNELKPKGKQPPMKVYNSQGDLVTVDPTSGDATRVYQAQPKPSNANPSYSPMYTETPVYDAGGNVIGINKTAVGSFDRRTGKYVPLEGETGGQAVTVAPPGAPATPPTVTPPTTGGPVQTKVVPPPAGYARTPDGGMAPVKGGPADPAQKITPQQSGTMAQTASSIKTIDNVTRYLMPDGKLSRTALAALANRVPMSDGRMYNDQMMESITAFVQNRSGLAVTDAERELYQKIFMPNSLDSAEGVKSKLDRLKQFFEGNYTFLPKELQEKFKSSSAPAASPTQGAMPARIKQSIDNAKAAMAKGWTRAQVEERLKAAGIDPKLLDQ